MKNQTTTPLAYILLLFILFSCKAKKKAKEYELNIFLPELQAVDKISPQLTSICKPLIVGDTLFFNPHIDGKSPMLYKIDLPKQNQLLYIGANNFLSNIFKSSNNNVTITKTIVSKFKDMSLIKPFVGVATERRSIQKHIDSLLILAKKSNQSVIILGKMGISKMDNYKGIPITYSLDSLQMMMKDKLLKSNDIALNVVYSVDIDLLNSSLSPSSNTTSKSIDKQTLKEGIYKALRQNPNNAYIVTRQLTFNYGTDIALFEDIMKKADEQLESIKKLNNVNDCSFIVTPLAYYSCAEVLAPNAKYKALAREKREEIKRIAKSKGCNLTEVSIPNS